MPQSIMSLKRTVHLQYLPFRVSTFYSPSPLQSIVLVVHTEPPLICFLSDFHEFYFFFLVFF